MDEIEQEVYGDYKVSDSIVADLMAKHGKDPEISSLFERLQELESLVFNENPKIPHIKCADIPEGLDEEMYVQVYRKQMAVFRHKIYKALKESGGMSEENKELHREVFG